MSEQAPVENVQNETPEISIESLQEQLTSINSQLEIERKEKEAVLAKNNELLAEKKKARQAKEEAEELARLQAEEKAKEVGDYKQLYDTLKQNSQKQVEDLQNQLNSLVENGKKEKIMIEAYKIAQESNAVNGKATDLMAKDIANSLDIVDGKFVYKNGDSMSEDLNSLKEHYSTSDDWAFARNSVKSSGGSASGAGTTSTKQKMTYDEFSKTYTTPSAQIEALKNSVEIINN